MSGGTPARRDETESTVEITKGDCHDCPWYEDCPRMRGLNLCYSDQAAEPARSDSSEAQQAAEDSARSK